MQPGCYSTSLRLCVSLRQTQSLSSQHTPSLFFHVTHDVSSSQLKAVVIALSKAITSISTQQGHNSDPTEVSRKYPAGFLNAMRYLSKLRTGKYRTDISDVFVLKQRLKFSILGTCMEAAVAWRVLQGAAGLTACFCIALRTTIPF